MFIRSSALLPVAALVALAAAQAPGQCNTGNTQCCDNTYSSADPTLNSFFSLIGFELPNVSGLVGAACTPITGIGASSGANCASQPVCCQGNTFNGLINFGCNPVSASG